MAEFDPEKFEDKYVHYLTELQGAYRSAFEYMNERYDSELVHAIDQQVLNESEPFYEGDGEFRIELPENPHDRIQGVLVDEERLDAVLEEYLDRLEAEIRRTFGFAGEE
jgi:predicted nucleotidyltransferase